MKIEAHHANDATRIVDTLYSPATAVADESPRRTRISLLTVLLVAGVFAGYSLLHVPVPGVNEPHYLCKARATWDSDWCANDFFLKSKSAHSVFFDSVGYFTQFWSLATVAVAGRILSSIVLAWGWTALAAAFRLNRGATVVAAALLAGIALTGNLSGEWILGGFESKVPSWGLGFAGIACWLNSANSVVAANWHRWLKTGLLLGLSTAAHPVVGAWFLIAISMSELALLYEPLQKRIQPGIAGRSWKSVGSQLVLLNGTALIAALPGLVPALQVVADSSLSDWDRATANRIQVFMRLSHHLDPSRFPPSAWIHSIVLLIVIGYCSWRLCKDDQQLVLRRHLLLLCSAIVIAATGIAIGAHNGPVLHLPQWSWRAFLLKFYPFRLVDTLLPVTVAFTVAILVTRSLAKYPDRLSPVLRRLAGAGLIATVLAASYGLRQDSPSGYPKEHYSEWKNACAWIRDNTPQDSLFVTPREAVAFKWYAERAEFVAYKDCPQDGAGILEWRQRLRDLGWMRPIQLQRSLKPSDLTWMHGHMQMTHLITRDHVVAGQDPIYENSVWRIYDLP